MMDLKLILMAVMLCMPAFSYAASEDVRTIKTADHFCATNDECKDIVSLELDGMYFKGYNERDSASIGTLINRKAREYKDYCSHVEGDKKTCESYRNQLMLKYITGLLDR